MAPSESWATLLRKTLDEGSALSGNYGHAGRPGEVGGSSPGDGSVSIDAGGTVDAGGKRMPITGMPFSFGLEKTFSLLPLPKSASLTSSYCFFLPAAATVF